MISSVPGPSSGSLTNIWHVSLVTHLTVSENDFSTSYCKSFASYFLKRGCRSNFNKHKCVNLEWLFVGFWQPGIHSSWFWFIFGAFSLTWIQPWWTVNHNHVAEPKDWPLTQAGALTSLPGIWIYSKVTKGRTRKGQTLLLTGNPWGDCSSVLLSTSPLRAWFLFLSFSETPPHFFFLVFPVILDVSQSCSTKLICCLSSTESVSFACNQKTSSLFLKSERTLPCEHWPICCRIFSILECHPIEAVSIP